MSGREISASFTSNLSQWTNFRFIGLEGAEEKDPSLSREVSLCISPSSISQTVTSPPAAGRILFGVRYSSSSPGARGCFSGRGVEGIMAEVDGRFPPLVPRSILGLREIGRAHV